MCTTNLLTLVIASLLLLVWHAPLAVVRGCPASGSQNLQLLTFTVSE